MKRTQLEDVLDIDDLEILKGMKKEAQMFLCDRVIRYFVEHKPTKPENISAKFDEFASGALEIARGGRSLDVFNRPYQQYLIKAGKFIYITRLKAAGEEPGQQAELCIIKMLKPKYCTDFKKSPRARFRFERAKIKNADQILYIAAQDT